MRTGRPSGYNPKYHIPWVKSLARQGLTLKEIAAEIGIGKSTLCNWANDNPDLLDALNEGRDIADSVVEDSLYKLAIGHTVIEKKTVVSATGEGEQKPARIEILEKQIPPNTTACIFWLKNRKRNRWTDRDNEFNNSEEQDLSPQIYIPDNKRETE